MRFVMFLAAVAALWGQPAHATAIWTFNVLAFTTGSTTFYPDPTPIPTQKYVSLLIDLPAFTTSANLSQRFICDTCNPIGDPTGLGGRTPGISGLVTLADGYFTGTNFLYSGGPAEFAPHTGADYRLTAPTFLITFVRSSDGSAPLPEPSTWALMLVGFAAIGFTMRARSAPSSLVLVAHA